MSAVDALRPPGRLDPAPAAYKDWLHLNVLDHASGTVGLLNTSLHGDPADERSRAIGTALFHVPDHGWIGNAEIRGIDEARIDVASIALEHVALAVDGRRVLASAQLPDDEIEIDVTAIATSAPVLAEETLPTAAGWIAWFGFPRLDVSGVGRVGPVELALESASAYHDHNWGRWHWGDDFGWEWGCFLPPAPAPSFVLSRVTDRPHSPSGSSLFVAYGRGGRRWFAGSSLAVHWAGTLEARARRVPGAVAALQQGRAAPRVPATLRVVADDGADRVELEFAARGVAQVIAADPARPGYGFIHELVGHFDYASRLRGEERAGSGLAVVEYVD